MSETQQPNRPFRQSLVIRADLDHFPSPPSHTPSARRLCQYSERRPLGQRLGRGLSSSRERRNKFVFVERLAK